MASKKEWMLGLPGHTELVSFEDVVRLISGGQIREADLIKKLGEPWRAANEVPELAEHFLKPAVHAKEPPRPTTRVPKNEPPPRRETARVPKADPPPPPAAVKEPPRAPKPADPPRKAAEPTRPAAPLRFKRPPEPEKPKVEEKIPKTPPPPPKKEETKPPEERKEEPAPPAAETPKPDTTHVEQAPKPETRAIPKRPPRVVPRLDPMAPKYYSPVDLLRLASHSFEPRKLLVTAGVLLPLMVFWALMDYLSGEVSGGWFRLGIFLGSTASVVFGLAVAWTALAYVSRRQLEGTPYKVADVIVYAVQNLPTALVYPLLVLIPSLLALAALWVLGFVRDMSTGAAAALKVLYFIPMFFALVAVAGVLLFQLASMYIPSAGAAEGLGLAGAARAAWANIRHQRGRMVLHWLIVTVAVGVITLVCLGLMEMAVRMPDWIFGVPRDAESIKAYLKWQEFRGLFAVYRGLAYGLGLTLPVSLLATLGMLSYLSLRHPFSAPLPSAVDETGGIEYGYGRGGPTPMEATHPADSPSATPPPGGEGVPGADTRPVPPAGPSDVADDSEEQTLA